MDKSYCSHRTTAQFRRWWRVVNVCAEEHDGVIAIQCELEVSSNQITQINQPIYSAQFGIDLQLEFE